MSKVKYAKNLINLTSYEFEIYEDFSGSIVAIPPEGYVPDSFYSPRLLGETVTTYYVVGNRVLKELVQRGRSLDDIAVIRGRSLGRHDKVVVYLASAEDKSVTIRLRNPSLSL